MSGWAAGAAWQLAEPELPLFALILLIIVMAGKLATDFAPMFRQPSWSMAKSRVLIDWNGQPLAGRTAIFVPAWADEGYGFTISQMFGVGPQPDGREPDCRVYVGCASENAAALSRTIVATAGDPQVRLVIHGGPDPACKVDVVDRLFQALHADEARLNIRFQTVLLHDASDGRHRLGLVRLDCSPACPIFTLRGLPSRGVLGYPWHPRWMFTFL